MENGSNVSVMLDDEINIMFSDWPETKDMLMKGNLPPSFHFFNCIIIVYFENKYTHVYIVLQNYIFQHIQIDFVCVYNRNG